MTKPADTFSLLSALATVAGAGSVENLFEPDLCLHSRVVGGSQLIPLRLAERLGDRVVLDAPVRTLRWHDHGVEVDAASIHVSARPAIVAVPPNVVGLIRFEPSLPAWRMRLHQAMTQGDVIKVLAVYDEPFWRAEGLAGEGFAPYELVREVYDNTPPAGRPGCSARSSRARRHRRPSGSTRMSGDVSFSTAWRASSTRSTRRDRVIERDWSQEEWTRGAYAATFGIGGLSRYGPDLTRPVGPVHWACTDLAGVGHMHMEGAIRSGPAAASAVLGRA